MAPDEDNELDYRPVGDRSDLDPAEIERYWGRVQRTLTDVFDMTNTLAKDAVADLRQRLGGLSGTEVHFYHADPFQVAADIARPGAEVTPEQKDRYLDVLEAEQDPYDLPKRGSLRRSIPDDPPPRD
jgi:hypothetical protein